MIKGQTYLFKNEDGFCSSHVILENDYHITFDNWYDLDGKFENTTLIISKNKEIIFNHIGTFSECLQEMQNVISNDKE